MSSVVETPAYSMDVVQDDALSVEISLSKMARGTHRLSCRDHRQPVLILFRLSLPMNHVPFNRCNPHPRVLCGK
jgi:hypothetical protein